MFDDEDDSASTLDFDLPEHEEAEVQQADVDDEDDALGIGAFDDVLNDPLVARVAPVELAERRVVASNPGVNVNTLRPSLQAQPQRSPRLTQVIRTEEPAPREQVYVQAMGPRPGKQKALGLDQATETNLAGLSLLVVGLGAAAGAGLWGWKGGAAGSLAGGAAINAYRASKASSAGDKKEAITSLTYAIVGGGVAAWLVWSHKQATRKERA